MQVKCPTCEKAVEWSEAAEFRPFCSKQCQLIDLGDWATEAHAISSNASEQQPAQIDEEALAEQIERQQPDFFKSS